MKLKIIETEMPDGTTAGQIVDAATGEAIEGIVDYECVKGAKKRGALLTLSDIGYEWRKFELPKTSVSRNGHLAAIADEVPFESEDPGAES